MYLAPMDGYTDIAFRLLCQRYGAEYCYTEMVSVVGLSRSSPSSLEKARVPEVDRSGIQLFGSDPKLFARSVDVISEFETFPKSIDINMGCSVEKVLEQEAGVILVEKPDLVARILERLTRYDYPISVKIRLGLHDKWAWRSLLRVLNEFDLQHITVHLRTGDKMYSGHAHWEILPEIVSRSGHPIIANGDVRSLKDAELLKSMGASNVMVGRQALSNPTVFSGGEIKDEQLATQILREYISLAKEYKCYDRTRLIRIALKLYRGFPGARSLRGSGRLLELLKEVEETVG